MAVDTAAKRFSMMSQFVRSPLIVPDGSIDQEDKQTFLLKYGGISFAALTAGKGVMMCHWQWDQYYDSE